MPGLLSNLIGGTLRGVGGGVAAGAGIAMQQNGERLRQAYLERRLRQEQSMHNERMAVGREETAYRRDKDAQNFALENIKLRKAERAANLEAEQSALEFGTEMDLKNRTLEEKGLKRTQDQQYREATLGQKDRELALKEQEHKAENGNGMGKLNKNQLLQKLMLEYKTSTSDPATGQVMEAYDWSKINSEFKRIAGNDVSTETMQQALQAVPAQPEGAVERGMGGGSRPYSPPSAAAETTQPAPVPAPQTTSAAAGGVPAPTPVPFEDLEKIAARRGVRVQEVVKKAQERGLQVMGLPHNFGPLWGVGRMKIR